MTVVQVSDEAALEFLETEEGQLWLNDVHRRLSKYTWADIKLDVEIPGPGDDDDPEPAGRAPWAVWEHSGAAWWWMPEDEGAVFWQWWFCESEEDKFCRYVADREGWPHP